jgi:hypothetical protein
MLHSHWCQSESVHLHRRFPIVSFQVLGHMKTVLVLSLGFLFFGKEGLNLEVL